MKLICCASYYGSGSSALTDLVSEYSSVKSFGDYEFSFLHDPNGVRDLYYNLVENPNRNNSGLALKRYRRLSRFLSGTWYKKGYDQFFDGEFSKQSEEYIKKLSNITYHGYFDFDLYDKGYFKYSLKRKIYKKLHFNCYSVLPKEEMICPIISKNMFINATREYLSALFTSAGEGCEFLSVDQLVPSSGIAQVLEFIPFETKVIIVDRDPRDCYILCKYVFNFDTLFPKDDVRKFAEWYRYSRICTSKDDLNNPSVFYVRFEDFIYDYENTVKKIEEFIGLKSEDHINKYDSLNPKKSFVNTQTWKLHPEETENIKYIEENLKEYLYDFNKFANKEICGIEIKNNKQF